MTKQIINIVTISVLATGIIFSCKKKDDPAPDPATTTGSSTSTTSGGTITSGGTTTGGGSGLQANSFTFNGRAFTTTTLTLSKDIYGTLNYMLTAYSADTTYVLTFRMPKYLPTTYTGNLAIASQSFTGTDLNIGLVRQKSSTGYFDNRYYLSGGSALITNQAGNLTIDVSNAGLNNSLTVGAKIVFAIPVIPSANASYNVPNGIADNAMSVGTISIAGNQKTIGSVSAVQNTYSKAEFAQTSGGTKNVLFQFAQNFPPTGNYVIVNSATNINAGEVYIKFQNFSPIMVLNSIASTGTVTVVNDQDDVSITAKDVLMTDGTQTLTLIGNYKH